MMQDRAAIMTIEQMCFLDLDDIRELRVACSHCGSVTTIPLAELSNVASLIERNCIACGTDSGIRKGTDEWTRIVGLVDHLIRVKDSLKNRNIRLSFRVECPKQV